MKWNTNELKKYQSKAHGKTCDCAECGERRAEEQFEAGLVSGWNGPNLVEW